MSLWCLREVDYDTIDFLKHCQLHFEDVCRECASVSRSRDDVSRSSSSRSDASMCRHRALRCAILNEQHHQRVPEIVSSWPHSTLRLRDIVLPEECDRFLNNTDDLWTLFLQGLLMTSRSCDCRLQRLDFTGFVPSHGLIYTFFQLVPFLSMQPYERRPQLIYSLVANQLAGSTDDLMLQSVQKYINTSLSHRIYRKESAIIHLPAGNMDVIVDFLPVNSTSLSFICYLVAEAIRHLTRINISINSVIFDYWHDEGERDDEQLTLTAGTQTRLDTITSRLMPLDQLGGLAVRNVPAASTVEILQQLASKLAAATSGHQGHVDSKLLQKLSLAYCHIDLAEQSHRLIVLSLFNSFGAVNRLDLSGTAISGHVADIVENIGSRGLQYLSLSHCSLDTEDVDALFLSRWTETLRDVDLSMVFSAQCQQCVQHQKQQVMQQPIHQMQRGERSAVSMPTAMTSSDDGESESGMGSSLGSPRCDSQSRVDGQYSIKTAETIDGGFWSAWSQLWTASERSDDDELDTSVELSSITSDVQQQPQQQQHEHDRILIENIVKAITKCKSLTILDISSGHFPFRVTEAMFDNIVRLVNDLHNLRHLSIESLPLWDEDILAFVSAATEATGHLQSVALSRSTGAPQLKTCDRFLFWKRLHDSKHGRQLRISIDNFLPDAELATSPVTDDTFEFCSGMAGCLSD